MVQLHKPIIVYVDAKVEGFLRRKVEDGFKISSFVRRLIEIEMKKEDKNGQ